MKAFEKWWNTDLTGEQFDSEIAGADESSIETKIDHFAKICWRAALEETLKQFTVKGNGKSEIRQWIEQELED